VTAAQAGNRASRYLIGDVQRFGLLSAAAVVDRYTQIIDRATRDASFPPTSAPAEEVGMGWMADSAARVAEAWVRLIESTSALITSRPGTAQLERVLLPATFTGSRSEISLWVHNRTASPAAVDLHATSLTSSIGVSIPADAVSFLPERLDVVEVGQAREVRLRVDVPADQPAGSYHGLVLISAAPGGPIAVGLEVGDAPESRP
jgi:hypothetical protein